MPPTATLPVACTITCADLTKRFGPRTVIDRLNWSLPPGQPSGLVGNSASGKSTLLRLIAGLAQPNAGSVSFGWPEGARRREPRISLLFQNLALWPHLTARRQVEWVVADGPRRERRRRAEQLLAEMRLPAAAWDRLPRQLSGGEEQRVALARALAASPDVLLLDEPLAHLDSSLRAEMLALLGSIAHQRAITTIYVTHAWSEVARLCSQAAVLDGGQIVQHDAPGAIYWQPASAAVARLTGEVIELPRIWFADGSLGAVDAAANVGLLETAASDILVRPRQVRPNRTSADPKWRVNERRPIEGGWWTVLESQGRRMELSLTDDCVPGECIALELLSVTAARDGRR